MVASCLYVATWTVLAALLRAVERRLSIVR
jgi:hypothetical protein